MKNSASARKLGFYLHTSWEFEYPFAVRSWRHADFSGFFALMEQLGFNLVMFWPLSEAMPEPLSGADRSELEAMRSLVDDAHRHGLEFWATFCANVTAQPEIAEKPFKQRHLYPYRIDVRHDDPVAKEQYLQHRAAIQRVLNNADAYVTIDGDPGGYPGAQAREFVDVLHADRAVIDLHGTHPHRQKIVPWIWSGWGADWERSGAWAEPLKPLVSPVLELLKQEMQPPWQLLPGRHIEESRGNGRDVLRLADDAGLIENSILLCYEIIEFEPTPPAVVLQFEDIRRVLRQEKPLIEKAMGIMGNAQQPIMVLPNLFFFARAAQDAAYLERSDGDVLHDLAVFLGGDESVLAPAWDCLRLDLEALPADLPGRLRSSRLTSPVAQLLPGGPARYLEILAAFVEARLGVLQACRQANDAEAQRLGLLALRTWWEVHRYVYSGEQGTGFSLQWTHPLLCAPLTDRGLV